MQTLQVRTPSHAYPIHIGKGLLADFSLFAPHIGKKAAIVTNTTVSALYAGALEKLLRDNGVETFSIVLADGEAHKNHQSLLQIYDALLAHRADRKTAVVALGGGVIGDTAGFAAATYQRGVPLIQIPTTLLSQVDSSVGGKTAVNHPLGKNMIGAFYQPQAVIADLDTLTTLPEREFSAGMAEVVKYALLGDAAFLAWLEENIGGIMRQDADLLAQTVAHCCQMKADIVAQDETEQGIRAHLNLGHTFGHAIEAEMGYGNWLHGEAVAAGMVLAAELSRVQGCLNAGEVARVSALLRAAALPVVPPEFPFERWLAHMRHDKKVQNGQMRFVTLRRLGEAQVSVLDDENLLRQVLSA
ncbi:3-dehydroquinate synthase [Conchiformibius kuhniae]|uniref:3-dehydroquinate synthase n=1 Tax=Conchiformibius kuhniae TaxID=211502 RepID=A0A8T9MTZ0_9NEIS|nr:3-dehydroquinate synthase [Conchiformibius kuhniae]UOP04759.1 3-dehydroquinate synthase [Conchiformibius kuhniae]